jgi:hypothetical protein
LANHLKLYLNVLPARRSAARQQMRRWLRTVCDIGALPSAR